MVKIGSRAERPTEDYHLTRYACYLVAMNGDPRKPEIAQAQTYFAVKTREAETGIAHQPYADHPFMQMLEGVKTLFISQEEQRVRLTLVESKVDAIIQEREEVKASLSLMPPPDVEIRELSTREKVVQSVDKLVHMSGKSHRAMWNLIYSDYARHKNINLTKRAENAGISKLDYIDNHGGMDYLLGLCYCYYEKTLNSSQF